MSIAMKGWHEENVEEGVRDIVRLLRDNGINTISSCHHDMTIQCDYVPQGTLQDIHNLIYNRFLETKEPCSFDLIVYHSVENGYTITSHVEIRLKRSLRKEIDDARFCE